MAFPFTKNWLILGVDRFYGNINGPAESRARAKGAQQPSKKALGVALDIAVVRESGSGAFSYLGCARLPIHSQSEQCTLRLNKKTAAQGSGKNYRETWNRYWVESRNRDTFSGVIVTLNWNISNCWHANDRVSLDRMEMDFRSTI
jgi:hypothetical protein